MNELKEIVLGKIADVQTGPFGSQLHQRDYVKKGTPIITVEHLLDDKIAHLPDIPKVSEKDKNRLIKYTLQEGDIVFSRVGSVDRCGYVSEKENGWMFSGRLLRVRPNQNLTLPKYLYFFLAQHNVKEFIRRIAVGSTMPSLNTSLLSEVPIILPDIGTQQSIAAILSCLDNKIDLLRRQNATLEHLAQTLFSRWFVEFEFPNEAGQSYKSSGGAMVASDLGEIPAGWRVGTLQELIEVNPKETIRKSSITKYIDMKALSTSGMEILRYIEREFTSGSKFRNGDTLLARITPCLENGKTGLVNILDDNDVAFGSTEFIVLRAKENCCKEFVYCLARNSEFRSNAIKNMTGSSGRKRIPNDIIENYQIVISDDVSITKDFEQINFPLFAKIAINQQQLQTLTRLRDTLLPKLMSGQIRVNSDMRRNA